MIQSMYTGSTQLPPDNRLKPQSSRARIVHLLCRDRIVAIALCVLVTLTICCIIGPPILDFCFDLQATDTDILERNLKPGQGIHLLGTDNLGRDLFTRLLVGGQISLGTAYFASLLSVIIGVSAGIISGYFGGLADSIFLWLITSLTSIPSIFLLLIVASIWSLSPVSLIIILALFSWVEVARLVRGEVLSLREREYVLAAHSMGASQRHIIFTHIVSNLLPIVIVRLTIDAGSFLLMESALSFLGLGIQAPMPTWGNMLVDARFLFIKAPHLVFWPGFLISVVILCFYLIGDGLLDALNPRTG